MTKKKPEKWEVVLFDPSAEPQEEPDYKVTLLSDNDLLDSSDDSAA
jgi:hypothetical protein